MDALRTDKEPAAPRQAQGFPLVPYLQGFGDWFRRHLVELRALSFPPVERSEKGFFSASIYPFGIDAIAFVLRSHVAASLRWSSESFLDRTDDDW